MTPMTDRDLQRYYNGTWLGLRTSEGITPMKIDGADGGNFITTEGTLHYTSSDIVYEYPDLGMVRTPNGVVYCFRKPERQWSKGVAPSLLMFYNLNTGQRGTLRDLDHRGQKELLKVLYNNNSQGVSRYAAKVKGEYWYRGHKIPDLEALKGTNLEYVHTYITNHTLEDVCV